MTQPHFSIILPTKDRVALVRDVLIHTTRQTFPDFEIILVDNGSDDSASRVAADICDSRIKILRTGNLNMPDNWQAGIEAASGKNLLMIEDKLFFAVDALEQCADLIHRSGSPLVSWMVGECDGPECPSLDRIGPCDFSTLPSREFFRYGSHCMLDRYQKQAPRGINMVVNRDFALKVQSTTGRLCRPISPDYSMGALLLPALESFAHTSMTLSRVLRRGPSNGANTGSRNAAAMAFLASLGMTDEELLQYVPLKIKTLHNLMVSDLFRFWRTAGVPESQVRLDLNGYFLMMIGDCVLMKKQNVEFGMERRQITAAFHARPLADRVAFLRYAFFRFVEGWPNRKLRMRENLPDAAKALGYLFKN